MHRCIALLGETNFDKQTYREAALAQRSKSDAPVTYNIKTASGTKHRQAVDTFKTALEAQLTQPLAPDRLRDEMHRMPRSREKQELVFMMFGLHHAAEKRLASLTPRVPNHELVVGVILARTSLRILDQSTHRRKSSCLDHEANGLKVASGVGSLGACRDLTNPSAQRRKKLLPDCCEDASPKPLNCLPILIQDVN